MPSKMQMSVPPVDQEIIKSIKQSHPQYANMDNKHIALLALRNGLQQLMSSQRMPQTKLRKGEAGGI